MICNKPICNFSCWDTKQCLCVGLPTGQGWVTMVMITQTWPILVLSAAFDMQELVGEAFHSTENTLLSPTNCCRSNNWQRYSYSDQFKNRPSYLLITDWSLTCHKKDKLQGPKDKIYPVPSTKYPWKMNKVLVETPVQKTPGKACFLVFRTPRVMLFTAQTSSFPISCKSSCYWRCSVEDQLKSYQSNKPLIESLQNRVVAFPPPLLWKEVQQAEIQQIQLPWSEESLACGIQPVSKMLKYSALLSSLPLKYTHVPTERKIWCQTAIFRTLQHKP